MRGERNEGGQGHRLDRIAQQILEEVSQIVGYELHDDRIGLATVTDVRLTPDFETARVFVSVAGSPDEQRLSLTALNHASGFVRRQLAPRLRTKRVPVIVFTLDDLAERGSRIENLLKEEDEP